MKNLFAVFSLLLLGCTAKYVGVIRQTTPYTAMVEVGAVINVTQFTFTHKKLSVIQSTETVKFYGSGVFISPNGHLLTCAHLFNEGQTLGINIEMSNGIVLPGKLLYKDDSKDLAIVKINAETKKAWFANDLQVGEEVVAIGNPVALGFTATHGIISSLDRDLGEGISFSQTDTPINPGNSGGPLFNLNGELVGINARVIPGKDGLAFAISLSTIKDFLSLFKGL